MKRIFKIGRFQFIFAWARPWRKVQPGFRREGNSTRLADQCVQEYFRDGQVAVVGHYPGPDAESFLVRKVARRLATEHMENFTIKGNIIIRDKVQ